MPGVPQYPHSRTDPFVCCDLKCFRRIGDEVDGLACTVCDHYGICVCRCATYRISKAINRIYFDEIARLTTFYDWPHTDPSPTDLARAGFYYTGRTDICRCPFCRTEIGRWSEGDEPIADHERWSPQCRFLRNDRGYNEEERVDVRGSGGNGDSDITNSVESLRGYVCSRRPLFMDYATEGARLESYLDWPISIRVRPNRLSDAGFYYLGKGDQTKCFHCGIGLNAWRDTDDPWTEHARHSPKCRYMQMVKGQDFIDEIIKAKAASNVATTKTTTTTTMASEPKVEKLPEGTVATSSERMCTICFSEEIGAIFLPCGHVAACTKCAVSLMKCAICRKDVTGTLRAFIA
ncbi:hypothetical protein GE061_020287 [Apolygus lucorum]|uniref:RING-type domain-containing protein n=1 Tax=Apolygus lucorum TaxID=248454 RepID=A0A8S9WIW3_APOLU|nr:hypothetical protein GE061_020287 [Apolygus lucorum]